MTTHVSHQGVVHRQSELSFTSTFVANSFLAVTFTVTFKVLGCTSGLPLLQTKSLSATMDATATRVLAAPQALRGALLVSFAGSQFAQVPVDATASQLSSALVSLGSGEVLFCTQWLLICGHGVCARAGIVGRLTTSNLASSLHGGPRWNPVFRVSVGVLR